jgi:hypothetical protein
MRKVILMIVALFMLGCVTPPDLETGEGCWRYGVLETGNTGMMTLTPVEDIRVEEYDYFDLLVMCDEMDYRSLARQRREGNSMIIRGCFQPREVDGKAGEDMIYLYNYSGRKELYEEQCHVVLGSLHNACYPKYGIGNSEADCNWK